MPPVSKPKPSPRSAIQDGVAFQKAGNLLQALQETRVIRCDEAPWRLFGISFAGYSALISAGLACVALYGAMKPNRPDEGPLEAA